MIGSPRMSTVTHPVGGWVNKNKDPIHSVLLKTISLLWCFYLHFGEGENWYWTQLSTNVTSYIFVEYWNTKKKKEGLEYFIFVSTHATDTYSERIIWSTQQ